MSNIYSTKEHPQYCIIRDGKEEGLLSGATRKMAAKRFIAEGVMLSKDSLTKR